MILELICLVDVKPDNILVDHGDSDGYYSKVVLSDIGDSVHLPSLPVLDQGHIIGSPIFRSPEATLALKWSYATDIWSFGATVGFTQAMWASSSNLKRCTVNQSDMGQRLAYFQTRSIRSRG